MQSDGQSRAKVLKWGPATAAWEIDWSRWSSSRLIKKSGSRLKAQGSGRVAQGSKLKKSSKRLKKSGSRQMQHHCTKHKSCLGGVPGVQATPEDWCPSPFFSTKSNWQKLRGSNLNISVIKGKWQPSFLLDLLHPSPSWMPFLIYLDGTSWAMRIYQPHCFFASSRILYLETNEQKSPHPLPGVRSPSCWSWQPRTVWITSITTVLAAS